ncbi:ABC transporter substrate-binding protein [Streptomyces sp. H10-C2]|uniref:ABC transporter substrate-binding protein n=1 Tax=unclassified Streptomyces TaxID=2593676 RepID=UPI0024B8DD71|nr:MULTISPECIES: ABC transporter substrate-binding protein [unclassified Streptomyces]MDJ0340971.1 ABC transporter substrate-binding protein [Streptomyces sp. PH10-H1]MDJ0369797.1 ABC transporter substrate-binding protein [Streptomyces sp. H10-C2]
MRWARTAGRVVLAGALLLAGYAGPGARAADGPSDSDGRGPMTLVTGRDLTGYLKDVLDGWNRTHPSERVKLIELPEAADEVRSQMADSLRSGSDRFDVLNIDVAWTSEFAGSGWIAPLDSRGLPLNRLLPSVAGTATFHGRLYAMPYVTNAGLLYYRKDLLDREGEKPPRTWAELERLATTVAAKYGIDGYAGQFLPYEGLTVNVVEAVQSAGGEILSGEGRQVTVDSPAALRGIDFLVRGVREGWIPPAALTFKEEESRRAFQSGKLLFLRNWPYVYSLASAKDSKVAGKFGVVPLPGPDGPGAGVLGGSNLAVNTHSQHRRSAADLIAYLTSESVQRRVLTEGSLPPVWASLYSDPELIRRFPYLPVLEESVRAARPRPKSARYEQVSLVVAAVTHDALALRLTPQQAIVRLNRELGDVVRGG